MDQISELNDRVRSAMMRGNPCAGHDKSHFFILFQGTIIQFDYNDTVIGVVSLIKGLKENTIDGLLLSIPTYYYFAYQIKHNQTYSTYADTIKGKIKCF